MTFKVLKIRLTFRKLKHRIWNKADYFFYIFHTNYPSKTTLMVIIDYDNNVILVFIKIWKYDFGRGIFLPPCSG